MTSFTSRPVRKHADDYFFMSMALLILVFVFIGFARTYYLAGVFHAKLPSPLVHLHGALFSCWILLLIAQIILASAGRVDWHMRLGILGMILAGLMVLVGFATIIGAVRRHSTPGMSTEALFALDVLQLTVFAILISGALALRSDGATHKRLMILATVALLGPALSRWPYDFVFSSDLAFYGTLDSFLIFMIAFDLCSRRKVHLATIAGSSLILVMDFAMRPMAHSALWHQFTAWVQSF
ncbi:MAG: hypothetical protein WA765_06535 [Candidatus Acidiferrum sp.]